MSRPIRNNPERRWEFFRSASGREIVRSEIDKAGLTQTERARLGVLLDRVASGRTMRADVTTLGDGIEEVRLSGDQRIFRLLFARVEDQHVLLAIRFFSKKSQKTPPNEIKTARKRRNQWLDTTGC